MLELTEFSEVILYISEEQKKLFIRLDRFND